MGSAESSLFIRPFYAASMCHFLTERAAAIPPRQGRVDASVSERPGGESVAMMQGSPHPTSLGYRLRSATLPRKGRDAVAPVSINRP